MSRKTTMALAAAAAAAGFVFAAQAEVVTNQYIEVGGEQHTDWGYTIVGLGDNGGEAAFVFTNATVAMSWSVPSSVSEFEYLVVGGGGGGGKSSSDGKGYAGGGGGAGGLLGAVAGSVPNGAEYAITVGAGGAAGANGSDSVLAVSGGDEVARAVGGGRGAGYDGSTGTRASASGGSGGGGRYQSTTGAAGTAGQGYAGGTGHNHGAGGGGAGAAGANATSSKSGGGGAGVASSITGTAVFYAGGGGGGSKGEAVGTGGNGGGGKGGTGSSTGGSGGAGKSGVDGLGGGGGGAGRYASAANSGGRGGNGVVVIRCLTVSKSINGWAVEPVIRDFTPDDAFPLVPPTPIHGSVVTVYDGDQSVCPMTGGQHTVTYSVEEDGEYWGYSQTYNFTISYRGLGDGCYRIPGLGANGDEVAVVFTNTAYDSSSPITCRLPPDVTSVRYLVVAGGGGGGCCQGNSNGAGGGGGAGGALANTVEVLGGELVSVYVGKGGRGAYHSATDTNNSNVQGDSGKNSSLTIGENAAVVANGGGGGGSGHKKAGVAGGCGGGACANGAAGSGSQGYPGGSYTSSTGAGSGGGGMGGAGGNATSTVGGAGGVGIENDISGVSRWYCGGGGGGARSSSASGAGGSGGGGAGGSSGSKFGKNATYYGGGGGGNYNNANSPYYAGSGYQGVVIIRYTESKPQNFWTGEPALSKAVWFSSDEPAALAPATTRYGAPAAYLVCGGVTNAFTGAFPTDAGEYEIVYDATAVAEAYVPPELTRSVAFRVVGDDEVPPFTVEMPEAPVTVVNTDTVDVRIAYSNFCELASQRTVDLHAICWYGSDESSAVDTVVAGGVALDETGTATVADVLTGTNFNVRIYGVGGDTVSPTSAVRTVTVEGPSAVSAAATFTNDPKVFTVSGTVTPGLGTTTMKIFWSINSDALDQCETVVFSYGDSGEFSRSFAYTDMSDTFSWKIELSNEFGASGWSSETAVSTRTRVETAAVTYTWTGNGDDSRWKNPDNWSANRNDCWGYPDSADYATASFTKAADVDFNGESVSLAASGLQFATGISEVRFRNGTLTWPSADNDVGAADTVLVLEDMTVVRSGSTAYLGQATDAQLVFVGTNTVNAQYRQWNAGDMRMTVRDGKTTFTQIPVQSVKNATQNLSTIVISNAMLATVNDGPITPTDTVWCIQPGGCLFASDVFGFSGSTPMNFQLAARGAEGPFINAGLIKSGSADGAINVDVTDFAGGAKVPLIRIRTPGQGGITNLVTLTAYANGVDVTAERKAKLVWDDADNTLYYRQARDGLAIIFQ